MLKLFFFLRFALIWLRIRNARPASTESKSNQQFENYLLFTFSFFNKPDERKT